MMKATLTSRYQSEKSAATATACLNLASSGDVLLKISVPETTIISGPSLQDLVLSLQKPSAFTIDYNVNKKDLNFQFMNSFKFMEKDVDLVYTHNRCTSMTMVNASIAVDPAHQVSVNYALGSNCCTVKHTYKQGELTVLENTFGMFENTLDSSVTRKIHGGHSVKASYCNSDRKLGMEWHNNAFFNGCFRLSASMDLAGQQKIPSFTAEHTWSYEI